jgi:hypothetical protein
VNPYLSQISTAHKRALINRTEYTHNGTVIVFLKKFFIFVSFRYIIV